MSEKGRNNQYGESVIGKTYINLACDLFRIHITHFTKVYEIK